MHVRNKGIIGTLLGLYFILIMGTYISRSMHRTVAQLPRDADELAWFYHTQFFELFTQHNTTDPSWQSLEAYDHPPVSKYMYGAYLQLRAPQYARDRIAFLTTFGSWYDGNIDVFPYDHPAFVSYVRYMRELNVLFALAIFMLAGFLMWRLTGSMVLSFAFASWLGTIASFQLILIRAVSDAQYLFFLVGAWGFFAVYLKKSHNGFLVLSAAFGALSFSSKLLGGVYFFIVPLFLLLELYLRKAQRTTVMRAFILVCLVGAGIWILMNPTLYPAPVSNSIKYLTMRESIVYYQMQELHNMPDILSTPLQRIQYISCTFFHTPFHLPCKDWGITPYWYINIPFFLAGLYTLIKDAYKRRSRLALFFLTALITMAMLTIGMLQFAWERYLIAHQIIFSLITFLGVYTACRMLVTHTVRKV